MKPYYAFFTLLLLSTAAFAANNRDLSPLPPKVLYHIGQKKHLQEDERLGGIPDAVWENNIMGRDTRFGLVPYRRGLYGGKNFDSLEFYGNNYLTSGEKKIPWVMKIVLKDECRKPENVTDLATDQNYLKWLFENSAYLARNASFCLNLATKDCRDLIVGTQPVSQGREENACDDVMQKMLADTKVKIVRDTEWDASWYIRDRACIEKLEANALSTLETLAQAKWDMGSRVEAASPSNGFGAIRGYGVSSFLILLGALREADGVHESVLALLKERLEASDLHIALSEIAKMPWVSKTGPVVIDAYSRCKAGGKMDAFRKPAEKFEEEVFKIFAQKHKLAQEVQLLEAAAVSLGANLGTACR
jgi:hypothetical protein